MAKRKLSKIVAVCVIAAITSSCSPWNNDPPRRQEVPHGYSSGGQTLDDAKSTFEDLPGLTLTRLNGGDEPNIKGNTGYSLSFILESGYRITNGESLVNFVMASLWSIRDKYMPNAQIAIAIISDPEINFDVAAVAASAGWTKPSEPVPGSEGYSIATIVMYDGSPARERLGSWPGPVPTVPTDITARITDREATPNG